MLTSITLQNFKSFGEEQTIPLQPITVLVGPNNSGKSNLVSLGRFIRNVVFEGNEDNAFEQEGGVDFVFHRPASETHRDLHIAWSAETGSNGKGTYSTTLSRQQTSSGVSQEDECLEIEGQGKPWYEAKATTPPTMSIPGSDMQWQKSQRPAEGLRMVYRHDNLKIEAYRPIWAPVVTSKEIKLSLPSLRSDSEVVPLPQLGMDGSNLPSVLGLWRGSDPDRSERLEHFIRQCLPEIKHVLVKPSPTPSYQRLWIQQVDGQQFDATHVSDGVLCFIALAMHAIEADPGSLLFVEEPEQSIHPRRLGEIVNLFREIVYERQCQIILATHSPVILHEFRDEPDSILIFRRGENGTLVTPLTKFPNLMSALDDKRADPGEMLINGFLNEPS